MARVSGFFASATQNLDRSGEKYPGRGRGQEDAARAGGRLVRAAAPVGALGRGPGRVGREAQGSCNGIFC
jgi:hypothetical protein